MAAGPWDWLLAHGIGCLDADSKAAEPSSHLADATATAVLCLPAGKHPFIVALLSGVGPSSALTIYPDIPRAFSGTWPQQLLFTGLAAHGHGRRQYCASHDRRAAW